MVFKFKEQKLLQFIIILHHNSLALETLAAAVTGEVCGEPLDLVKDEDDSVDQRAEKFIEWFYQEMRLQRQDSI